MHNKTKIVSAVNRIGTPAYIYDLDLLNATIDSLLKSSQGRFTVHYAIKANNSEKIVRHIASKGLGADCVSIGEVEHAVRCGIKPCDIAYAGVGKTDSEIERAIIIGIGCFNVESIEELMIISEIASKTGKPAKVSLRINPDIDAHTHHYITTGLADNKFGIPMSRLDEAVKIAAESVSLEFNGLHFHIGSQILTPEPFVILAERINRMVDHIENDLGIEVKSINTGGGLGINYDDPDSGLIPEFDHYFKPLLENLNVRANQTLHCELGRSIIAQCGTLVGRVQYVKSAPSKKFVILDAGMNNLIRPALYQARHDIENLTSTNDLVEKYDVVGPICESSDVFASDISLPLTARGDLIAIRSAGAYGASMSSSYNMRDEAKEVFI